MYLFTIKTKPDVCIEVDTLIPEKLEGLKEKEVKNLTIREGKKEVKVEELFEVEEIEGVLTFKGKWLDRVKKIGFNMKKGEIYVDGDVGMYLGAFMKGGKIIVNGNVDRFAGMNMSGGEIEIVGSAGDYLGSAYRGDYGMKGGKIKVNGDAGNEVGIKMRGGEIIVKGKAGMFFGGMINGGLLRAYEAIRAGANMKSGTIVLERVEEVLPGFIYLGKDKFENEVYHVFEGDKAVKKSNGRLYVREIGENK